MKTIDIDAAGACTVNQATGKNALGQDTGDTWTLQPEQLEKHRAQFPEIDADHALKDKADAVRDKFKAKA